jgi:hypothetical protein
MNNCEVGILGIILLVVILTIAIVCITISVILIILRKQIGYKYSLDKYKRRYGDLVGYDPSQYESNIKRYAQATGIHLPKNI